MNKILISVFDSERAAFEGLRGQKVEATIDAVPIRVVSASSCWRCVFPSLGSCRITDPK